VERRRAKKPRRQQSPKQSADRLTESSSLAVEQRAKAETRVRAKRLLELLNGPARSFAQAEFFCGTIDQAFFSEAPLVAALEAKGLGHVNGAARGPEWAAVRAAAGISRPRRLSAAFLAQARSVFFSSYEA
jgi:hypothetical protein